MSLCKQGLPGDSRSVQAGAASSTASRATQAAAAKLMCGSSGYSGHTCQTQLQMMAQHLPSVWWPARPYPDLPILDTVCF